MPAHGTRPVTGRPHHQQRQRPGGIVGHNEAVIRGETRSGYILEAAGNDGAQIVQLSALPGGSAATRLSASNFAQLILVT